MQAFNTNWQKIADDLRVFQQLPGETRQRFLEVVRPRKPAYPFDLGDHLQVLCASGFLKPSVTGANASVPPHYWDFCRLMRALARHPIFDDPSRESFLSYLRDNFTVEERDRFCPRRGRYYYGQHGDELEVFSRISTAATLRKFLADPEGDDASGDSSGRLGFRLPEVLVALQDLLRQLMPSRLPIPLFELRKAWEGGRAALLSAALVEGMQRLLVFPALYGPEREIVVGLWPSVTRELLRTVPQPPRPVTPQGVFEAPFMIDDMAVILWLCAVETLRLRQYSSELFERSFQLLAAQLGPLPEWVEKQFEVKQKERASWALKFLQDFQFVEPVGENGVERHLEASEAGREWLRLGAKERLKRVMDFFLGNVKNRPLEFGYSDSFDSLMPYELMTYGAREHEGAIRSGVLGAYAARTGNDFVRLDDFTGYYTYNNNPLNGLGTRAVSVMVRGRAVSMPTVDELADAWAGLLREFLRWRLLPLGGVKVGADSEGAPCFAMTDAGRYLVRAQVDFTLAPTVGRIVVQPNFDVVFLVPSSVAESEIARFAERKGRNVGTLFKITKRSITAAAASGLTLDATLATLRGCCQGGIPANVELEISGWFVHCRRIGIRPAILIHCPDAETAMRVQAVARSKVTPVSETVLEVLGGTPRDALVKKLREAGIFVDSYKAGLNTDPTEEEEL